jgi:hypothetical protein
MAQGVGRNVWDCQALKPNWHVTWAIYIRDEFYLLLCNP